MTTIEEANTAQRCAEAREAARRETRAEARELRRLLTPQQSDALALLCNGLAQTQVAQALGVSQSTVNAWVASARATLGADTVTEACITFAAGGPPPTAQEYAAAQAAARVLNPNDVTVMALVACGYTLEEISDRTGATYTQTRRVVDKARAVFGAKTATQTCVRHAWTHLWSAQDCKGLGCRNEDEAKHE
jgi:DNA-binding NarL/FixJ family response regulator